MDETNPLEATVKDLRAENKALAAKVAALVITVAGIVKGLELTPVKVDGTIVLCSWFNAPGGSGFKCGWTGRSDKYQKHLDENHGGKDYVAPKVGIPVKEA